MGIVGQGEAKEKIARDEVAFLDQGRMRAMVVGGVEVTEGEGRT